MNAAEPPSAVVRMQELDSERLACSPFLARSLAVEIKLRSARKPLMALKETRTQHRQAQCG
jgi:hypothetical protein